MVHLKVQSIIYLKLHNKAKDSFPKRCSRDCRSERILNALENALKNGIKSANECKTGQLKNKSKNELFSAPCDPFEVCLKIQCRVHLIIQLDLHLQVHFKIYIKMHKKVHLRCTKRCTSGCS